MYVFNRKERHQATLEVGALTFFLRKPRLTDLTWLKGDGNNAYAQKSIEGAQELWVWKKKHGLDSFEDPDSEEFREAWTEAYTKDPITIRFEIEPEDIRKHQTYLVRLITDVEGMVDEDENPLSWSDLTEKEKVLLLDTTLDDLSFSRLNSIVSNLYLADKASLLQRHEKDSA